MSESQSAIFFLCCCWLAYLEFIHVPQLPLHFLTMRSGGASYRRDAGWCRLGCFGPHLQGSLFARGRLRPCRMTSCIHLSLSHEFLRRKRGRMIISFKNGMTMCSHPTCLTTTIAIIFILFHILSSLALPHPCLVVSADPARHHSAVRELSSGAGRVSCCDMHEDTGHPPWPSLQPR